MRTLVLSIGIGSFLALSVPAAAQRPAFDDGHDRAAAELIEVLRMKEMTATTTDLMMESMLADNPTLGRFRDIFEDFFDEHLSWQDLLPEYVRIYRDAYTEAELRELIAFYRTPLGRKTVEVMPRLMQEANTIVQRRIQPHLPELQRRIQERMGGGSQR